MQAQTRVPTQPVIESVNQSSESCETAATNSSTLQQHHTAPNSRRTRSSNSASQSEHTRSASLRIAANSLCSCKHGKTSACRHATCPSARLSAAAKSSASAELSSSASKTRLRIQRERKDGIRQIADCDCDSCRKAECHGFQKSAENGTVAASGRYHPIKDPINW